MSPLARPLLALAALLAALLAAACAECNTKMLGYATLINVSLPIVTTPPVGDVIEVREDYYLGYVVGERIVACNNNPRGPAPEIEVTDDPPDFLSIAVACYEDFCPDGATVNITQYYKDIIGTW